MVACDLRQASWENLSMITNVVGFFQAPKLWSKRLPGLLAESKLARSSGTIAMGVGKALKVGREIK